MFKSIRHPFRAIRNFFSNLYRLGYWFPVIWKDRWWDWAFIFILLEHKLRYDLKRYEKHGMHVGVEKQVRQMKIAAALCKRMVDNDYNLFFTHEWVCKSDEPFDLDLKGEWIGQFGGEDWYKHDDYMEAQDIELLTKILRKHLRAWWD